MAVSMGGYGISRESRTLYLYIENRHAGREKAETGLPLPCLYVPWNGVFFFKTPPPPGRSEARWEGGTAVPPGTPSMVRFIKPGKYWFDGLAFPRGLHKEKLFYHPVISVR
jgi:hypothetical protein